VERAHTKSLDANDKLIQTRSHVRDTTASRKRQVRMRKVKTTILVTTIISQDTISTQSVSMAKNMSDNRRSVQTLVRGGLFINGI